MLDVDQARCDAIIMTTNLVDLDDVGQERQCFNLSCDEVHKHLSVEAWTFPEKQQQKEHSNSTEHK